MKNDHSASHHDSAPTNVALASNGWTRFWFTPIPATGLHCLRVLSGVLFLCWLCSFMGHQQEFFSLNGWFDREAYIEVLRQQNAGQSVAPAPIGWSILYLARDNADAFQALYWGSLVVLALFTLGVATRLTSILTWVIVASFLANPATSYEGDYLLNILAFYLMIGYVLVGQWSRDLTIWHWRFGFRDDFVLSPWLFAESSARAVPVSYAANFVMRLLQIHMVLIILTSVLHKMQISDWWTGVALWYPFHLPFQTTAESLNREMASANSTLFVASLLTYATLAWQISFPLFAWRMGRWRGLLLGGAAIYWLGVFFLFRLPLFGPFMLLGCLSFLTPDEWAWIVQRAKSLGSRPTTAAKTSAAKAEPPKAPVMAGKENIKR